MMAVIAKVSEDLKAKGVNDLYVLIPAGDSKLLKFEQMMGFDIHQEVYDPFTNEVKYLKLRYNDGN